MKNNETLFQCRDHGKKVTITATLLSRVVFDVIQRLTGRKRTGMNDTLEKIVSEQME